MERNYFLMIIIFIVCVVNLFAIAEYSDIVGSASVDFRGVTFSLPRNFELINTNVKYVEVHNPNFGNIALSYTNLDKLTPKDNYHRQLNFIKENKNQTILSNGTINVNNYTVYCVYYKQITKDNNVNNLSNFFFSKGNLSFNVAMGSFNYNTQKNETIDNLIIILNSLRPNYKI